MKRILIAMLIAVSLLAACVMLPADRGHRSGGVVIVPLLPEVVVLDAQPYYFYSDYHYHYDNNRWYYSKSRNGPWAELPRDHYPKEIRYKGKSWKHDRRRDDDHRDRNQDDDRGYDNQHR